MPAPQPHDVRIFPTAAAFRAWLEHHHATAADQWVGYYKKGVAKAAMSYPESVDEALCYGWIDGITRRIDDEVYAVRFTPRRRTSSWSAVNIAKIAELTATGRMHPAGRRAFEERDRRKDASYSYERPARQLPRDWHARLRANERAHAFWEAAAPSFRRMATRWVMSAKRDETRARRFEQLLTEAAAGRRPRPFLVTREERNA
jgi:uncharacterized protein YdeI (YjbR/CyaY-like superfamily)